MIAAVQLIESAGADVPSSGFIGGDTSQWAPDIDNTK
jgi:hypothetical protein